MTREEFMKRRWQWPIAAFLVLILASAGVWVWRSRTSRRTAGRPVPTPSFETDASSATAIVGAEHRTTARQPDDVIITLEPEKLANASLKIETVAVHQGPVVGTGLQATGTVQSDAYKETPVMPIVPGIIREVSVALGEQVSAGQKLATLFSSELADAQTAYLKVQAEIEKHHKHFRRAAELVELGAISREEYEDIESQYKTEEAELKAARQRLILYGLTGKQIDELSSGREMSALIVVAAPAGGLILTRTVNPGEVVNMGKELFRLADLSTVWVIGQVYEQDLAAVRIGSVATITASAYPSKKFSGRVAYVDPRIEPQTRTAQVRIEVANLGQQLKIGMFVTVSLNGAPHRLVESRAMVQVPRSALQVIGSKRVVFLATNEAGVFAQRNVEPASEAGDLAVIERGLDAGDRVVTDGSFLLRAESLKLNPTQSRESEQSRKAQIEQQPSSTAERAAPEGPMQEATIFINERGYQPDTVRLRRGIRARLVFVRKVEATCSTEVVIADFGIRKEIPFDKPVTIEFTPDKAGDFKFSCGMGMLNGRLIVR